MPPPRRRSHHHHRRSAEGENLPSCSPINERVAAYYHHHLVLLLSPAVAAKEGGAVGEMERDGQRERRSEIRSSSASGGDDRDFRPFILPPILPSCRLPALQHNLRDSRGTFPDYVVVVPSLPVIAVIASLVRNSGDESLDDALALSRRRRGGSNRNDGRHTQQLKPTALSE